MRKVKVILLGHAGAKKAPKRVQKGRQFMTKIKENLYVDVSWRLKILLIAIQILIKIK